MVAVMVVVVVEAEVVVEVVVSPAAAFALVMSAKAIQSPLTWLCNLTA